MDSGWSDHPDGGVRKFAHYVENARNNLVIRIEKLRDMLGGQESLRVRDKTSCYLRVKNLLPIINLRDEFENAVN